MKYDVTTKENAKTGAIVFIAKRTPQKKVDGTALIKKKAVQEEALSGKDGGIDMETMVANVWKYLGTATSEGRGSGSITTKVSPVADKKENKKPETPPYISAFEDVANEVLDTFKAKNSDYGNSAHETYKMFGDMSYAIRLNDKLSRFQALIRPGYEARVKDESIEDTLKDLATYALMAVVDRRLVKDKD